ncbi:MAG: molybdopterin dinucleotide binding domain-containing protein, partial [Actinomycetota bacterium]
GDTIDVSEADAARLGITAGMRVRVTSPRGSVEMPARIDPGLPEGLTFTTFHFPELVDINQLTNDAWDKRSGTSEFKAAAIRIEPLELTAPVSGAAASASASGTAAGGGGVAG